MYVTINPSYMYTAVVTLYELFLCFHFFMGDILLNTTSPDIPLRKLNNLLFFFSVMQLQINGASLENNLTLLEWSTLT